MDVMQSPLSSLVGKNVRDSESLKHTRITNTYGRGLLSTCRVSRPGRVLRVLLVFRVAWKSLGRRENEGSFRVSAIPLRLFSGFQSLLSISHRSVWPRPRFFIHTPSRGKPVPSLEHLENRVRRRWVKNVTGFRPLGKSCYTHIRRSLQRREYYQNPP